MAFDQKTKLNNMLTGQPGEAAATPGKQTLPDGPTEDTEGGFADEQGGKGEAGPATAAKPGAKPAASPGISIFTKPAAGDPSTKRTTVGVGEIVELTGEGPGDWQGATPVPEPDGHQGTKAKFTAPETGGKTVTITHTPKDGTAKSVQLSVVAPSAVEFKKLGDVPVGPAGVGMRTMVNIQPTTVSFEHVDWLEQGGAAGAPQGVEEYFAAYAAKGGDLTHKPNENGVPMGANNNEIRDNAWTRDKPKLTHKDGTQRWWAGKYHWNIPNNYRVRGSETQHYIADVTQAFVMDDAGKVTVTKGAASATQHASGLTEGDLEKYTTIEEAQAMLNVHKRTGCIQAVMHYLANPKRDPASVANLLKALEREDVTVVAFITCKNTYAWTDPDSVIMTAKGPKGAVPFKEVKVNDNKDKKSGKLLGAKTVFSVKQLLELSTMTTANVITFSAMVEGKHEQTATFRYPFDRVDDAPMAGSDRYFVNLYFE